VKRAEVEVRVADGRRLLVEVAGPEDGDVVLFHAGTPGARSLYEPNLEEGARRGLRHVCYSRPGYEGSDRWPGRSIADCVGDTKAVADALEIDAFHTVGHSCGGPCALACAALLPDRVRAVATVSSIAPIAAEGIDWWAGMAPDNIVEFETARNGDRELQGYLESKAAGILAAEDGQLLGETLDDLFSEVDQTALKEGERADFDVESCRRVLASGIWGWFDDVKACCVDWGFELDRAAAPVTVWHGGEDRMIPSAHGEWLAGHLPNAELRLLSEEGHVSLIDRYSSVLDGLIASAA
jgi:pimeloyl-ACP methyl ester carboxylesterase